MKNSNMKPRPAGSVYEAVETAFAELGGTTQAAEALELSRPYVHAMTDADATGRHKATITLQQAGRLSEQGATALASWLAAKAGGTFIPNCDAACGAAIQDAVANFSRESGEAIGASIEAALRSDDTEAAIRELDQALAWGARLRSKLMANGNTKPLRVA